MRIPMPENTLVWLKPGMHVKRWLLVLLLGIGLLSLGLALLLRQMIAGVGGVLWLRILTLQDMPFGLRVSLLVVLGVALLALAVLRLSHSLLMPFVRPEQGGVGQQLYRHHRRRHGPMIVALGGGTGLSTLLRGLKEYSDNITAIVSVADDGGSSGKLRQATGMLPPGDLRQCIVALSEAEGLTGRLFQYRFTDDMGLQGHNFGNLFIAAMADVSGSFERGLLESSRVLAVRGQVIPSTLEQVMLGADLRINDGQNGHGWRRVLGESAITEARQDIERVFLQPESVVAYPEAIKAILEADLIVAGPGSLFTSILPNLLIPSIAAAIRSANASKVYICNVATQPGETTNFDVDAHVQALRKHVGDLFPHTLANDRLIAPGEENPHLEPVLLPETPPQEYTLYTADLIDEAHPWRHDSAKLAQVLMNLYFETNS